MKKVLSSLTQFIPYRIDAKFIRYASIPIVPKKLQSAFGYRLQKNPLWNQTNQIGLWNYDHFSTIQWRPHLIWPSSHKEIWIFVKQVIGPFLPAKFCHLNVCGFHRQIVFTQDRLANIFKFYAYLSNKGCSWQPKRLSDNIMWNYVNNTFHKDHQGQ